MEQINGKRINTIKENKQKRKTTNSQPRFTQNGENVQNSRLLFARSVILVENNSQQGSSIQLVV